MSSTIQPAEEQVLYDRRGNVYTPVVGPRLRWVLWLIFTLFALLGANSVYLASLKAMNWWFGQEYRNWLDPYMLLAHLALGTLLLLPFGLFVIIHLKAALGRPNRPAVRLGVGLLITGAV